MTEISHLPVCPICKGKMRTGEGENATSRYDGHLTICNQCGVREAFDGKFWVKVGDRYFGGQS